MMQPAARLGQILQTRAGQRRLHRAAVGVAAKNRVFHFQHFHRIFDGRRASIHIICIYRDHVAGVARDEQVAGPVPKNKSGSTRESEQVMNSHSGAWLSAKQVKLAFPPWKHLGQKFLVPLNQTVHSRKITFQNFGSTQLPAPAYRIVFSFDPALRLLTWFRHLWRAFAVKTRIIRVRLSNRHSLDTAGHAGANRRHHRSRSPKQNRSHRHPGARAARCSFRVGRRR